MQRKEEKMYFDTNKDSLTIANLLALVRKDRSHADDFPYTKEICRCRYCRFCCGGKCALKSCCCIAERVKARACTFVEAMYHSFRCYYVTFRICLLLHTDKTSSGKRNHFRLIYLLHLHLEIRAVLDFVLFRKLVPFKMPYM